MKRLISLMMVLCMLVGFCPAGAEKVDEEISAQVESSLGAAEAAEEEIRMIPGEGYSFDFTLRLHPEAFSAKLQARMTGYVDLLQALRFQGTFVRALEEEVFELKLSVIPVNYTAGTVEVRLLGTEEQIFLKSSLFGDQMILLNCYSMLAFCSKMSEHLGIPLQYVALAYPYSWKYAMHLIIENLQFVLDTEDENGVIPEMWVRYLYDCLQFRLNEDELFLTLVDALCKNKEVEESFRAIVQAVPEYVLEQVFQEQEFQIVRENGTTTWRTASGDIYTETITDQGVTERVSLPWMKIGYLPVYSLETFRENDSVSGHLRAQLLGEGQLQNIVNLEASLVSLPETWPVDCYSLVSVNLTGGLLPNGGVACILSGERTGHVKIELRKPTVEMEIGAVMLTLEGELLPLEGNVQLEDTSLAWVEKALDLFVSNDVKINAFLPDLVRPLTRGVMQFLIGIPTSACQTLMDDMTELGIFEVLMGE